MKLAKGPRNRYILFHGDQQLVLRAHELTTAYKLIRDGVVMENGKSNKFKNDDKR